MREILFRGKDISGQWHYGVPLMLNEDYVCIAKLNEYNKTVEYKTLGQYTGLNDKNGKKIFEGDILRYYDDEIQIVEWNKEFSNLMLHTYCKYERKKGRKVVIENSDGWNWLHDYPLNKMSIIGNIHDNPELLKEGVRMTVQEAIKILNPDADVV